MNPRSTEAGNKSCATLLKGTTKIGPQRAMKSHRKAWSKHTTHIHPQVIDGREHM
jgi:hypothetical protein